MSRAQTAIVTLAVVAVLAAGGYLGWTVLKPDHHRTYPQDVQDGFLVTCAAMGRGTNNDDLCHCALGRLEQEYSLSEFTELSLDNVDNQGRAAQPVIDAFQHCGGTYIPPAAPTTATSVDHSLELPPGDFRHQ